jgi:glycosyltransferase involved in cell wall biosynthesis
MSRPRTPHALIFEPEHLGHQPAYVHALASWLQRNAVPMEVTFVVGRPLLERLRAEDSFDLERSVAVGVSVLTDDEVSRCTQGSVARKAMARWSVVCGRLAATGATHAHVLFLDPFQLPLALGRSPGHGRTLSGILFRPSIHSLGASDHVPAAERFRDSLKAALYGRMLRNSSLTRVLTLDPFFPQHARERFANGAKVRTLPDPIIEDSTASGVIGVDVVSAPVDGRAMFLMFGALTVRKGVLEILQALLALPADVRARIRVVLAGRIDPECAAQVAELRRRLESVDAGAESLWVVDRFLSTAELEWLVERSETVLVTYRRHVGSSGALVWAARHGKPVLAQDYGLVGALVREYRLGEVVDATDPEAIAAAIVGLADPDTRRSIAANADWRRFLAGRSADEFASQVVDAIREAA